MRRCIATPGFFASSTSISAPVDESIAASFPNLLSLGITDDPASETFTPDELVIEFSCVRSWARHSPTSLSCDYGAHHNFQRLPSTFRQYITALEDIYGQGKFASVAALVMPLSNRVNECGSANLYSKVEYMVVSSS
ncbi:hypothetical protein B0H16DRAFT_1731994 [Mycena metata]|uniref:Uncharacterized protein n=1 Tax=Mycena metata TaxID=1033252 RepID=A0AAD7MVI7_9AGAR|nr:hypothetical protein B0H16DRAFT_1731994 [Mycena metata]